MYKQIVALFADIVQQNSGENVLIQTNDNINLRWYSKYATAIIT